MNRFFVGLSLSALLLMASPVFTQVITIQPFPGIQQGGDPTLELLRNKDVQTDLKLNDMQAKAISDLAQKQEDALKGLKFADRITKLKELAQTNKQIIGGLLMPKQFTRLEQLKIQQKGPAALRDPQIVAELQITDDQKAKIMDIQKGSLTKRTDIFKQNKGNPTEIQKKIAELNKELVQEMVKTLTPAQQQKWNGIIGAPFKGTLPAATPFPGSSIGGTINIQPVPIPPKQVPPAPVQPKQL